MSTNNHLPACRTLRRLIARWVLELLEIVLIGCHIHIVLGVEAFTARFAGLPGTRMTLMIVIGTERVAIVIAPTAIAGIRKQHICVAIIADPVVTTKRFSYFPGFTAQTTTRLGYRFVCRFCHREHAPLVSLLLSHSLPSCGWQTFSFWGKLHEWVCSLLLFYHSPSSEDFLKEEGILEASSTTAVKRVLAWQIAEAMRTQQLTRSAMAARMHTSRSQLERLLDPEKTGVSLETIQRAAAVVGRELRVELV